MTALSALEALSRAPAGVSELARSLGLPKTTAHRCLMTLREAGWVRPSHRDPSRWVLTGRALTVGLAGSVEGNLRELARAELTKLRDATGETIHLVVPDGRELVVVGRVDGTHSVRTFLPLGTHAPLFATASGRALLSAMGDEEVAAVLEGDLASFTASTVHDRAEVWREIERSRERGYALNAAEWRSDTAALGVPICSPRGTVVAAVAISMPLTRFEDADLGELSQLAIDCAKRITEQLHIWEQGDTWID
jgi:DNA-binding IclR family transcriptional regulator